LRNAGMLPEQVYYSRKYITRAISSLGQTYCFMFKNPQKFWEGLNQSDLSEQSADRFYLFYQSNL